MFPPSAPGMYEREIVIPLVNDVTAEMTENFGITLTATNALNYGWEATVYIEDNDGGPVTTVEFASSGYTVGEDGKTVSLEVKLNAAAANPMVVEWSSAGEGLSPASSPADYSPGSGVVKFAIGEKSKAIAIAIVDNLAPGANKSAKFTLGQISGGGALGWQATTVLTITDNDMPPEATVTFTSTLWSVNESDGSAEFEVKMDQATTRTSPVAVTVKIGDSADTAARFADYVAPEEVTLTWLPTESGTSKSFTVTIYIIDDIKQESAKNISLALTKPSNATLGSPSTATVTIQDDDVPVTVQFEVADYSVWESAGSALIWAQLSAASDQVVTIDYSMVDKSAKAPNDYAATKGTFVFEPNQTSGFFEVTIVNDAELESAETVELTLSNPTNATLGLTATATLTIEDDDVPPPQVQFARSQFIVTEDGAQAFISVSLDYPAGTVVKVDYSTSDGSATEKEDYLPVKDTLVFGPDDMLKEFSITILPDMVSDPDETVNLTLTNPQKATLGLQSTAILTIQDSPFLTTSEMKPKVVLNIYNGQNAKVPVVKKVEVGAFTVANLNDSDGDGIVDKDDDDIPPKQAKGREEGEVDMMKLEILKPIPEDGGKVKLTKMGSIKLWKTQTKDKQKEVTETEFETKAALPMELFIEATAVSAKLRDIEIEIEYKGVKEQVNATAIWVEKTKFTNTGKKIEADGKNINKAFGFQGGQLGQGPRIKLHLDYCVEA